MLASVNDIQLYYEKTGSGRPLVLVHGNGEDHSIFNEAVRLLSGRFTCYAVDSRCHGRSTHNVPLHYEDMAADICAFLEALDLRDVVFYGFSDGGIVGLLAAMRSERITTLVTSGANLSPAGVSFKLRLLLRFWYWLRRDPLIGLMLREPHITVPQLRQIKAQTLVLAGSGDLILEEETRRIAEAIPGAQLRILEGEDHGSYIVHSDKIARLLLDFCG